MVLLTGVSKATGLRAALDELRLSPRNTAGIGDAENDHAFLEACELSFAVAGALDAVKDRCDVVTEGDDGAGVVALVERLLDDDLEGVVSSTRRLQRDLELLILGVRGKELLWKALGSTRLQTLSEEELGRLASRAQEQVGGLEGLHAHAVKTQL